MNSKQDRIDIAFDFLQTMQDVIIENSDLRQEIEHLKEINAILRKSLQQHDDNITEYIDIAVVGLLEWLIIDYIFEKVMDALLSQNTPV